MTPWVRNQKPCQPLRLRQAKGGGEWCRCGCLPPTLWLGFLPTYIYIRGACLENSNEAEQKWMLGILPNWISQIFALILNLILEGTES